jgi:hypothetical protein
MGVSAPGYTGAVVYASGGARASRPADDRGGAAYRSPYRSQAESMMPPTRAS